jgi:hypothetical protein
MVSITKDVESAYTSFEVARWARADLLVKPKSLSNNIKTVLLSVMISYYGLRMIGHCKIVSFFCVLLVYVCPPMKRKVDEKIVRFICSFTSTCTGDLSAQGSSVFSQNRLDSFQHGTETNQSQLSEIGLSSSLNLANKTNNPSSILSQEIPPGGDGFSSTLPSPTSSSIQEEDAEFKKSALVWSSISQLSADQSSASGSPNNANQRPVHEASSQPPAQSNVTEQRPNITLFPSTPSISLSTTPTFPQTHIPSPPIQQATQPLISDFSAPSSSIQPAVNTLPNAGPRSMDEATVKYRQKTLKALRTNSSVNCENRYGTCVSSFLQQTSFAGPFDQGTGGVSDRKHKGELVYLHIGKSGEEIYGTISDDGIFTSIDNKNVQFKVKENQYGVFTEVGNEDCTGFYLDYNKSYSCAFRSLLVALAYSNNQSIPVKNLRTGTNEELGRVTLDNGESFSVDDLRKKMATLLNEEMKKLEDLRARSQSTNPTDAVDAQKALEEMQKMEGDYFEVIPLLAEENIKGIWDLSKEGEEGRPRNAEVHFSLVAYAGSKIFRRPIAWIDNNNGITMHIIPAEGPSFGYGTDPIRSKDEWKSCKRGDELLLETANTCAEIFQKPQFENVAEVKTYFSNNGPADVFKATVENEIKNKETNPFYASSTYEDYASSIRQKNELQIQKCQNFVKNNPDLLTVYCAPGHFEVVLPEVPLQEPSQSVTFSPVSSSPDNSVGSSTNENLVTWHSVLPSHQQFGVNPFPPPQTNIVPRASSQPANPPTVPIVFNNVAFPPLPSQKNSQNSLGQPGMGVPVFPYQQQQMPSFKPSSLGVSPIASSPSLQNNIIAYRSATLKMLRSDGKINCEGYATEFLKEVRKKFSLAGPFEVGTGGSIPVMHQGKPVVSLYRNRSREEIRGTVTENGNEPIGSELEFTSLDDKTKVMVKKTGVNMYSAPSSYAAFVATCQPNQEYDCMFRSLGAILQYENLRQLKIENWKGDSETGMSKHFGVIPIKGNDYFVDGLRQLTAKTMKNANDSIIEYIYREAWDLDKGDDGKPFSQMPFGDHVGQGFAAMLGRPVVIISKGSAGGTVFCVCLPEVKLAKFGDHIRSKSDWDNRVLWVQGNREHNSNVTQEDILQTTCKNYEAYVEYMKKKQTQAFGDFLKFMDSQQNPLFLYHDMSSQHFMTMLPEPPKVSGSPM